MTTAIDRQSETFADAAFGVGTKSQYAVLKGREGLSVGDPSRELDCPYDSFVRSSALCR